MKYVDAFAIADSAVSDLQQGGMAFKPGTPRRAALAAVPFDTEDEIKSAMKTAIKSGLVNQRLGKGNG